MPMEQSISGRQFVASHQTLALPRDALHSDESMGLEVWQGGNLVFHHPRKTRIATSRGRIKIVCTVSGVIRIVLRSLTFEFCSEIVIFVSECVQRLQYLLIGHIPFHVAVTDGSVA